MIAFRYLGAIFFISSISCFLRPKILTGHALPVYSTYFKVSFQLNWVRNFARFSAQFERVGFRGKGKNAKGEWPMGIRISACSQATYQQARTLLPLLQKHPSSPFGSLFGLFIHCRLSSSCQIRGSWTSRECFLGMMLWSLTLNRLWFWTDMC